ncbi:NAD-dependent epimerase/dehydratase family protein, partial [Candidatus Woesearchaeota archaeon]|nr:NAD-dependent epimerase/dehydratase family protein [Candidatus Woesearchaeota archaeon]
MNILVTGGAGFIGFHVAKALLERGDSVIIVDNLNDYYDPQLKKD